MAEENTSGAQAEQQMPKMHIVSQYIRDLSFENIAAQKNLDSDLKPEINVQVNLDANKKGDNLFEVSLKLIVNAKSGEQAVFLLEVDYAGTFAIENLPEQQTHPFLMIECPRMLFPFLRRIVSDVTRDGGYPPLNIDNIDFMALYKNEIARRVAEQAKANTEQPTVN
jgi:preprotein translocase subunit SecB